MAIAYEKFIHPEDRAALEKLKAIPLLDTAVRQYLKYLTEDMLHGINMASKIKLGPNQLPEIYAILNDVCAKLEIAVPEFYLEMDPQPNAYTCGDTKPFVVINSGIVDLLQPDELRAVVAHECGHILCHHVLYHMLADVILSTGGGIASVFGAGIITEPLKWALTYWVRRSEFSADRVAAYVTGDADIVARTMMRLAGGGTKITSSVNMEEFMRQAAEYNKFIRDSDKSSFLQNWMIKDLDHPYPAIRAAEVVKWFKSAPSIGIGQKLIGDIGSATLKW